MSSLVLPTLPGLKMNVQREPYWRVNTRETLTGKELRSTYWSYARIRYRLDYALLRANSLLEFQKLFGFISRHAHQWDSFLFTDPEDNSVASHYFGVGNNSTTSFQLQRTLVADADLAAAASRSYWPVIGDGYEPIFEMNGAPSIFIAGALQSLNVGYTLGLTTGIVTFTLPPPSGTPTGTPSTTGGTLAAGTRYYRVSALNASGESIGSTEASATTTGTTGSVALTWAAVMGATSYRVYYGTAAGAEASYYAPGNVTSFTDTGAAGSAGSPLAAPTATQPPAAGAALSWTGSFYRRVRLDADRISATRIVQSFWELKTLPLISVKP